MGLSSEARRNSSRPELVAEASEYYTTTRAVVYTTTAAEVQRELTRRCMVRRSQVDAKISLDRRKLFLTLPPSRLPADIRWTRRVQSVCCPGRWLRLRFERCASVGEDSSRQVSAAAAVAAALVI